MQAPFRQMSYSCFHASARAATAEVGDPGHAASPQQGSSWPAGKLLSKGIFLHELGEPIVGSTQGPYRSAVLPEPQVPAGLTASRQRLRPSLLPCNVLKVHFQSFHCRIFPKPKSSRQMQAPKLRQYNHAAANFHEYSLWAANAAHHAN